MRTVVGLLVIVLIIAFVAVVLWRRRGRDEIHSIDSYRNALDTLQEMRGAPGSASIRVLAPEEQESLRQPPPQSTIKTGVVDSPLEVTPPPDVVSPPPGAVDGMVFNDDVSELGRSTPAPESEPTRGHENPSWAIGRMEGRPRVQGRQLLVAGVAVVVVVLLVVVGVAIGTKHSASHAATTQHSSTTVAHHPKHPVPSTTTTTAAPTTFAPENATATSATYAMVSNRFAVTITATQGACWTVATDAAGKQVFAGSIAPGTPQVIKSRGTLVVTLGAPANVSVSVGGTPVTFPSGYQTPLVLTFQYSAPTTTTAPSATTTSTTSTTLPVTTTSGITP